MKETHQWSRVCGLHGLYVKAELMSFLLQNLLMDGLGIVPASRDQLEHLIHDLCDLIVLGCVDGGDA